MEVIKRKILIKDTEEQDSFYFKIPILQHIDDLGLMSDMPKDANMELIKGGPTGYVEFMNQYNGEDYYKGSGKIIASTDSKLEMVRSYSNETPFIESFNIRSSDYYNYLNELITGVDRVVNIDEDSDEITYVIDTKRGSTLGTTGQTTGLLYVDFPNDGVAIPNELDAETTTTNVQYIGEGWNQRNVSVDPIIREEYLLGIINKPEVESDVFIDRGRTTVLDTHLRLSEVESLDHLERYGNGFYNINRD
tara:strand:+ start:1262 stop:2008 length:747 start_codon:yes stop_codon:yes gene_type:complete